MEIKKCYLAILFILPMLSGCNKEEELIVPGYMAERFSKNLSCVDIDYIKIHFPDSMIYISDTATSTTFYNTIQRQNIGGTFEDTEQGWRIGFQFHVGEKVTSQVDFVLPGSYFFTEVLTDNIYKLGVEVSLRLDSTDISNRLYSTQDSQYFHVYGVSGDGYKMTVCGDFDVLLVGKNYPEPTRVYGDYQMTIFDYFH